MKKLNHINQARGAMNRSALGLAVGAAVVFGVGQSAHAALNYTFADTGNLVANMQGWTSVFPGNYTAGNSDNAAMWANYSWWGFPTDGQLGDGWDLMNTQLGQSPAFTLDGSGALTWQMLGTPSPVSAPTVHSADMTATALAGTGFMGVALRDVATDTYVLWNAFAGSDFSTGNPSGGAHPEWSDLSFTAAQLAPYANNGRSYALDFIDNDKAPVVDDHWVILGGATIPGALAVPEPTTAALGGLGLGLLALQRRRRNA